MRATWARVSRLRGDSETVLSYPAVSLEMARLLDTPLVQQHPKLRLRCLIVKGAADLSSKDPETSGQVWAEALKLAESLKDQFWTGRCSGELAVTAFLKGETAKAVRLNTRAFNIAQQIGDVQGEIRQKSLDGVGLLEQGRYDAAMIRSCPMANWVTFRLKRWLMRMEDTRSRRTVSLTFPRQPSSTFYVR